MSFLNIKDPVKREKMIVDYLVLKKRLQKCNMEERGDLVDRQRDLEENVELVVTSNKMTAKEIVDELTPIMKELWELKEKAAGAARQKQLASDSLKAGVKRDIDSQPQSKQRRVYGHHQILPSKVSNRYNIWYLLRRW